MLGSVKRLRCRFSTRRNCIGRVHAHIQVCAHRIDHLIHMAFIEMVRAFDELVINSNVFLFPSQLIGLLITLMISKVFLHFLLQIVSH